MQLRHLLSSAVLLLACTPKSADSADGSGSSGALTEGAEASSASHTEPTSGGQTTSGGPTSGTDPTTAAQTVASSDDAGTGPVNETEAETEGEPGACEAVCNHWEECSPGSAGPVEKCVAACIGGLAGPDCGSALMAQWSCVAALDCAEALKFLGEEPTSCLEEKAAADQMCMMEPACDGEIGGDMETCEHEQQCGSDKESIACDGDTCTCSVNDVPGKQCPANGLCALDFDEQQAAVAACCGFDWS